MLRKLPRHLSARKNVFMEGGKYKWARHFDRCITCGRGEVKHKSRGNCIRCYEKARAKKPNRIEVRKKALEKWNNKLKIKYSINVVKKKIHRQVYSKVLSKLNGYYEKWYGKQKFIRSEYKRLQDQYKRIVNDGKQPMLFRYGKQIIHTPFWLDTNDTDGQELARGRLRSKNKYVKTTNRQYRSIDCQYKGYLPYSRDLKIWIHKTQGIPIKDIKLGMSECSNYIN